MMDANNIYQTYDNVKFTADKQYYPKFNLLTFDTLGNSISSYPGWTLESYITADDITYERRIPLCSDKEFKIFYCPADTSLPID
jgi:hypothetical protein